MTKKQDGKKKIIINDRKDVNKSTDGARPVRSELTQMLSGDASYYIQQQRLLSH